jgi:hypothetical protein
LGDDAYLISRKGFVPEESFEIRDESIKKVFGKVCARMKT